MSVRAAEYVARLGVARIKSKQMGEQVYTATLRIEKLVEELRGKQEPKDYERRLEEIEEICAASRAWVDELK